MAYLGNRNGPRESEILNKLGHIYLGCSPGELDADISDMEYSESRGVVAPVHVDVAGRPYIEFTSPEPGRTRTFVLEEHGYDWLREKNGVPSA